MKNLKTLLISLSLFLGYSTASFSQENYNALNVSTQFASETRINAHYEITVGKSITLSPAITLPFDFDWVTLGGRADLYVDSLFNISNKLDIWLGIDTGIIISGDDSFSLNGHAGIEYKINNFFGIIGEAGGGTSSYGSIGMAFHF